MLKKTLIISGLFFFISLKIFSFSEIPHQKMIFGTWYDKTNKIVMYFSDNKKYKIRIIRKQRHTGTEVLGPIIMTGYYLMLAQNLHTVVYNNKNKKNLYVK